MNILLVCTMGMSTSILVSNMKEEAKKQNKKVKIWAIDIDSLEDEDDYDIVLLGPQVIYRKNEIEEVVPTNIPIHIIDKKDYGSVNGKAVLELVESIILDKKQKGGE